ncbi:hypothetical protein MRX96_036911 [Rhipicephalus microplus]
MSHTEIANLPREILIVLGKPYMITTNIDVIDGLVNGAVGILKVCERAVNDSDLPKRLWLHFDDATTTVVALAAAADASQRPHIIVIVADDLGWADVGHHGSRQLLTPNMDWLAADGLTLAQHYVQSSSTATRSALLTGLYPIHTGG